MKIVFATGNAHKLQEINEISAGSGIEFILPPKGFNPIENGKTFEENSLIKAREAARLSKMISLADDSGLCVEALGGAPGIHSARYAETAQARIDKLLDELNRCEQMLSNPANSSEHKILNQFPNDILNRKAKFVCAMTLVNSDGEILFQTRGECHGEIAKEQSGVNGFGYDPIFIPTHTITHSPKGRGNIVTMAEMSEDEKNEISHRGRALRKVLEFLKGN